MGEIFMFCKKCGFQCNDGAVFCQKCGTPLETQQQPVQQPVQQPAPMPQQAQQPFAYNAPTQQPVQQQDYNAPVQQPMQQQGYGMPAQQPLPQPYYSMPAKQPMSKGVLAAIIGSAVAIVALIVVLLVVLLGDSGSSGGGGGGRSDDDEPSVTTSKTDKTNKTNKNDNSGDAEDVADAFAEAVINGDADSVFDLLHEDTIDYVVDYAGYSSRRDMVSDLDEQWTDDITEMEDYGINLRFDYSVGRSEPVDDDELDDIVAYYDEEFGLEVKSAVLIEVELIVEMDYGDGWEEDSSYFDLFVLEIDGDWYLDAVETIPQVW